MLLNGIPEANAWKAGIAATSGGSHDGEHNASVDSVHVLDLEVRYLWVDTLCIIQDDSEEKDFQLSTQMQCISDRPR